MERLQLPGQRPGGQPALEKPGQPGAFADDMGYILETLVANSGPLQVYQKNKLVDALELYTQSICLAPHPPPSPNTFVFQNMAGGGGGSDHDDGGMGGHQYEELALGFANRSAVLFQLKEYELCIRDITR